MATYRYPNDFQSPVAGALSNLVSSIASLPGPEERALKQAQLEQIRTATALNQSKIADAQREAAVGGNLAGVFRRVLTPVEETRPTPDTVGPMPEVPVDKRFAQALPDLVGSLPPAQLGQFGALARALAANAPGTTDPTVTRAMLGAGDSYNSTPVGAGQERERKYAAEADKNVRAENAARYAAERQAAAAQYAADRQAKAIEASSARTPQKVIGPDGKAYWQFGPENIAGREAPFDQQSGPLAADATKAGLQWDALQSFKQKGADFLNLARNAPDALGAAGALRTIVAGAAEQAKALGTSMGIESAPQLVGAAQDFLREKGISVADPAVASKIAVYVHQLPYDAAAALAGQQGRSVTDADVKRFQRLLGDTPITNLADLEARWEVINKIIDDEGQRLQPRLTRQAPGARLGTNVTTPLMPTAPAPAAAPAPVAQPKPVQKWGRDPATGKPVPVGP